MHYIIINFTYKVTDFQGDNQRERQDYLLYFYNTAEECELKYENVREYLSKKYNVYGRGAYEVAGEYWSELDEDDIDYRIGEVKVSEK